MIYYNVNIGTSVGIIYKVGLYYKGTLIMDNRRYRTKGYVYIEEVTYELTKIYQKKLEVVNG